MEASEWVRDRPGGGAYGGTGMSRPSGVLSEDMCFLRVYFFANCSCRCSLGYAFQSHSKLCVPSGYTTSRFLIVCYVLSGSGPGSPGGTTPSIFVPSARGDRFQI